MSKERLMGKKTQKPLRRHCCLQMHSRLFNSPATAAFKLFAFTAKNRKVVKIDFLYSQREINFSGIDNSKTDKLLPSI